MDKPERRGRGLETALDILIAPRTAFERLRAVPTWGWAFIIASALGMLGAAALVPAFGHALAVEFPARLAASPQVAQLPAAQRDDLIAKQLGVAQTIGRFSFVLVPLGLAVGSALQALVMLVANAIGKGDGNFKKFWALAVNAGVIGTGIASIVLAAIALIRGAANFSSTAEITQALPGLGTLVPVEAKAAAAFFGVMNVFAIWDLALVAIGMTVVARLSRGIAIATAVALLAGAGLFPLAGALFAK